MFVIILWKRASVALFVSSWPFIVISRCFEFVSFLASESSFANLRCLTPGYSFIPIKLSKTFVRFQLIYFSKILYTLWFLLASYWSYASIFHSVYNFVLWIISVSVRIDSFALQYCRSVCAPFHISFDFLWPSFISS